MLLYHNDDILYLLNYLNILVLFPTYFEIGFSYGSLLRYFYPLFNRREEYKQFILGKLLFLYGKEIKTEFIRRFTRFMTLSILNDKNIGKYKCKSINKFISNIDIEKYYEINHYKQLFKKVDNIKKNDLEKFLAKSYRLSKELNGRMRRIEINIGNRINGIIRNIKKRACNCMYKCCISSFCKRIKFIFFLSIIFHKKQRLRF